MRSKRVLIFGSSLCRDLSYLDERRSYLLNNNTTINLSYNFHPGKSFEFFLRNPHLLPKILACDGQTPDIVLVIFGGNSISTQVEDKVLYKYARDFYSLLRCELNNLNPNAIVIASEVPMRYVYSGFKNTPRPELFKAVRHRLNLKIRDIKSKNYLCRVESDGRLDKKSFYRDGIHFKPRGNVRFMNIILCTLSYVLRRH